MNLRAQVDYADATTPGADRQESEDAPQHHPQIVTTSEPDSRAAVSCCLIVKDRLDVIEKCINSVRPYVAEVNIFDTGSTDGTLELLDCMASEPGSPIRVERGEWRDDFALARNRSFEMASPEIPWWCWLDSDDVLLRGERLAEVVAEMEARDAPGALIAYDYMGSGVNADFQPFFRMARARSVRWRAIVHEQWLFNDAIRKGRTSERIPELVVVRPPLMVRHRRHDHDVHRYTALMRKAATDLENNPRTHYFLAETLLQTEEWEEALCSAQLWLATVERHEGKWTPYRAVALGFVIQAALGLGNDELAVAAAEDLVAYLRAWSQAAINDPEFVAAPSASEKVNGLNHNDNDMILHAERVLSELRETSKLRRELVAASEQLAKWEDYKTTYRAPVTPGRNEKCPCGSGLKSKRCCFA